MIISNIANSVESVLTRQIFNKAKEYDNVIDLTLGDPNLPTPNNIIEASYKMMCEKKIKYSANAGLIELRNAISDTIYNEYKIRYYPETEIVVTVGGMEGLYLSLISMINAEDEVIIFAPYYPNYLQMIKMCGAIPIIVNTFEENNFYPDFTSITKVLTKKTRAIIINSPNNPTGAVYPESVITMIIEIARNNNIIIITDEVYKAYTYTNKPYFSVLDDNTMKTNTVLINSLSKKYSMTGWRVGYVASNRKLIENMIKLQENIVACAPVPSQYAAIEALTGNQDFVKKTIQDFEKKRNFFINNLNEIPKLSCYFPQGAFYAYVNISKISNDSLTFAYDLLEKIQVAIVPGIAFGGDGNKYIRICYALSNDVLETAINRLKEYIK